jgi:hypothetical protein
VAGAAVEAAVAVQAAERVVTRLQPAATIRRRPRQVATLLQAAMPLREEEARAVVDVVAVQVAAVEAAMRLRQRLRRRPIPYRL